MVIPLHRDHGVITMAAGKNDVIKLLPPLTLSEAEVTRFLEALDAVLADCQGGKNWSVVREIATSTLSRRATRKLRVVADAPFRGTPVDRSRDDVCLVTGASGFIGGHLAQRLLDEGMQVRGLVRHTSDTSQLEQLNVEIAVGDLTSARSLARATDGCRYVFHCGALVSDWATTQEITRTNVEGTRNLLDAAAAASVARFIHFSSTDVYGYPGGAGIDETFSPQGFANWYSQSKRVAESHVRRAQEERGLDTVVLRPATVYGPRSVDVVGEIAKGIYTGKMLLVDRGRAVAGLVYIDNLIDAAVLALRHDGASGHAFNVSDGLDVTWREFTDGLARGLGRPQVRWSIPYHVANGIGFALEHGYRAVRRTTGITSPPLLSRQAVHVMGRPQDFSARKARELLGWEPQVGYEAGLEKTLAWLKEEHLAP